MDLALNQSPGVAVVCPPFGKRVLVLAYDLTPKGGEAVLRNGAGPDIVATLPADKRTTWQDPNGRDVQYCLTAHGPSGSHLGGTVTYRFV